MDRHGALEPAEVNAFARRWGLLLPDDESCQSNALWTAEALPSVIALTRLPPELGHPEVQAQASVA